MPYDTSSPGAMLVLKLGEPERAAIGVLMAALSTKIGRAATPFEAALAAIEAQAASLAAFGGYTVPVSKPDQP